MSSENTEKIKPRGAEVQLPHGGLPEVIPNYLQQLISETGGASGPIGLQFVAQPALERADFAGVASDPLMEDHHEVAPGLVYKYTSRQEGDKTYNGRALWTITRSCAAYCRFCTRGREVGLSASQEGSSDATLAHTPHLALAQIDETLSFIKQEPNLNEIILSGGDPLTVKPDILDYILSNLGQLQQTKKLSIVRIGTRLPIHNPKAIKDSHFDAVSKLKNPRLMVHINHPSELTNESLTVLNRFRRECNAIVMSQSVLLRGVNDSVDTLYNLFSTLAEEGIIPYYIYQNDPVYWAKHFTVPFDDAVDLWQQLRPKLSGVAATARFVIDVPNGYGKIPIPEGDAWNIDYSAGFKDFQGTNHPTNSLIVRPSPSAGFLFDH